jgi:quercetin dioxygenase-like cupin family protein
MAKIDIWATEPREIVEGFNGRFVHTERTTHVYWDISPGLPLPEHSHPHEQIVNMLEGTFEIVVAGTPHVLNAGDVLVIAPNVPHSGVAHTPCKILDVFSPVREEYR